MPIWEKLKEKVGRVWPFVKEKAVATFDYISGWWDRFQGRIGTIRASLGAIWDTAKTKWDEFSNSIKNAYISYLKPIVDFLTGGFDSLKQTFEFIKTLVSDIVSTAGDLLSNAIGIAKDTVGDFFGGGTDTAAGGATGGGGTTYNITVNATGITDRTDKRELAREIGNMIQQELARSQGGSTMSGRF